MTQNNGEFVRIATSTNTDIPALTQTPEAEIQTRLISSIINQRPVLGAVIDGHGRNLDVIAWFTNIVDGSMFANVDNGTITTDPSGKGEITVRIQDQITGDVHTYAMADVASAFVLLGLSAKRCNGINLWHSISTDPTITDSPQSHQVPLSCQGKSGSAVSPNG